MEEERNWKEIPLDCREVCEHLYDGIHITDGNGRIIYINSAYTRTTGILPEEILGKKVEDIERGGALYQGSVTTQVLERKERVNSVAHIVRLDKEVLVTGTPVFDEAGEIKLVVTNTRDFPALKSLERQLLTMREANRLADEELAYLRHQQTGSKTIVFQGEGMQKTMELIQTVAGSDVSILITGESGTGKELIANEIYQRGRRYGKPFIKVNCAAIPAELLESELFGYEEGAFTGARKSGKIGMFELANTGVLLLDEIGDMPFSLQAKLLRVLQQRELRRIGGNRVIKLDIQIISSTNKDLREEIRKGNFREDLYYRLNVVPIEVRPLRERKEDIPVLAQHFCQTYNKKYGKDVRLTAEAVKLLTEYHWPGNIRELENMVERMVVTNTTGSINRFTVYSNLASPAGGHAAAEGVGKRSLKDLMGDYEKEIILLTLEREGTLRKAAACLGIDHSTLIKKMKRYQMRNRIVNGEKIHQSGEIIHRQKSSNMRRD